MALQPLCTVAALLSFPIYTQSVGLLGRGISPPQGRYLQRINAHTHIHASSGIRTHDPGVRMGEDVHALERAATVIGYDSEIEYELSASHYAYFNPRT
jgi:hypothetical protein